MKTTPYPMRGDWLITDEGAGLIVGVWETAHSTGKAERIALAMEARDGQPFKNERNCVVTDGVAIMNIDGPLMRKAELFTDISGATSYQWIGATVDKLRNDSSVRAVLIKANSPGGEAAGCGETAEKIARLAAEKHVEGYVETQAASAMYWLLSQCSHITAHPTAQVGWIGAVRTLTDDSKRDEQQGIKEIQIVSAGAEEKRSNPIDEKVVARVQRSTDEWGRLFTAGVAAGRGTTPKTVLEKFGRGDGMFAAAALKNGLIDEIGDFTSTLARLTSATPNLSTRATMSIKEETALAAGEEWQCAGCGEHMGPSAKSYCAKCADGDDDEDDDDEAKALGIEGKTTRAQRLAVMSDLASFKAGVLEATGQGAVPAALAAIVEGQAAIKARDDLAAKFAAAEAEQRKRDLAASLEQGLASGRLSLGAIQKTIPVVLRGDAKKAWTSAMDKLAADADAAKATLTAAQIVGAASSVALTADDLGAVREFVEASKPVAAPTHKEPARDAKLEASDLDETAQIVAKAAASARAAFKK